MRRGQHRVHGAAALPDSTVISDNASCAFAQKGGYQVYWYQPFAYFVPSSNHMHVTLFGRTGPNTFVTVNRSDMIFAELPIMAMACNRGSGTATLPIFGSIVQNG